MMCSMNVARNPIVVHQSQVYFVHRMNSDVLEFEGTLYEHCTDNFRGKICPKIKYLMKEKIFLSEYFLIVYKEAFKLHIPDY